MQDEIKNKSKTNPGIVLKMVVIISILVVFYFLSKFISNYFGGELPYGGVQLPVTKVFVFQPGMTMEVDKVYKIFEIPMTEEQGTQWLVGGDVIDGFFYTKCNVDYKLVPCASFDIINKKVEFFDFTGYKEKIKSDKPDYAIYQFVDEHATNLVTDGGIVIDPKTGDKIEPNSVGLSFGRKIDYRTDNYDYIMSCDPLMTYKQRRRHTSVRRDCIIINKRNGTFSDGKKDEVIVTSVSQPKGFVMLEKSLIWQQYNKGTGKTEYFMYSIE
ncbi:MAG TPA: hypothetical protein DEB09_02400 [Candidatus Magasanikbacteria bacterium]|nr:hypothetical protein [Candidatus Magasanikbacteria bacterium]